MDKNNLFLKKLLNKNYLLFYFLYFLFFLIFYLLLFLLYYLLKYFFEFKKEKNIEITSLLSEHSLTIFPHLFKHSFIFKYFSFKLLIINSCEFF